MDPDAVLPPAVERIRVEVPEDMKLLSIFTDVFDCFFRFLAANLAEEGVLDEEDVLAHGRRVRPRLPGRRCPNSPTSSPQYDMFAPEFALSCLNRLQLRNNKQMVDLADPSGALQLVGTLKNPIAGLLTAPDGRAPGVRSSGAAVFHVC